MGAMELQIFVSLLVVLGAAFVALICDFLKGNNEKLREVNIELLVRQEERERAEVGRDRVRRVKPVQEKALPGLAVRVASAQPVKEPAAAPPMNPPEGIPAYPRRRRAGRGADPEMRPAAASVMQPGQTTERPTAIEVMEDWARKVVERGAAGRSAETAPVPIPQSPIPVEVSPVHIEAAPIVVQAVPELTVREEAPAEIEPIAPQALQPIETAPVPAAPSPMAIEVSPVQIEAAPIVVQAEPELTACAETPAEMDLVAPQALHQIAGGDPVQTCVSPVQTAAEAAFAVVEQSREFDASELGSIAPTAGEQVSELVDGGLADVEVYPAAPAVFAHTIQPAPILVDSEPGMPLATSEAANAPIPVMTELVALPSDSEALSGARSEAASGSTPIPAMAAEASFQAKFDVELLPPDWTADEVEQAQAEEAAEVSEAPAPEFAVEGSAQFAAAVSSSAMITGDADTGFAEANEPSEDEIVRVKVLDEGDLIELSQPVEMRVAPIAAALAAEPRLLDLVRALFSGEGESEPVIGAISVPLEVVAPQPEELEVPAEAATEIEEEPDAEIPVVSFIEPPDDLDAFYTGDIDIEDLQDSEDARIALPGEAIELESEMPAPQAPLVQDEIEPVHSGLDRFVDLDSSPELNPKVVQMPAPVHTAPVANSAPAVVGIPSGIHDRQLLAELINQDAAFNGVVFFLGLLGYEHLIAEHGQPAVRHAVAAANEYFSSLLGGKGFGSWAEESLFVMVLPAESMDATRELNQQTAEGLWDYQLRSLGSLPIIFHWGSAEAAGEPLSLAVRSAREQMLESGRARKQVLSASGRFRRRVVNG
jgi:hypothetical protein